MPHLSYVWKLLTLIYNIRKSAQKTELNWKPRTPSRVDTCALQVLWLWLLLLKIKNKNLHTHKTILAKSLFKKKVFSLIFKTEKTVPSEYGWDGILFQSVGVALINDLPPVDFCKCQQNIFWDYFGQN